MNSQVASNNSSDDTLTLEDVLANLHFECGLRGDAEREVANLLFAELMACRVKLAAPSIDLRSLTTEQVLRAPLDLDSLAHWAEHSHTGRRLRARFPGLAALFVDEQPA